MSRNKKVLTITVPSYNAESYLKRGIPTLLDKSIMEDIEVIIVDDGSTDNTAKIADEYHMQYPDTIQVIHKENGGHGSTINSGIRAASGKYFCVIDADDWVDTANFVKLVKILRNSSSDLVLANAVEVNSEDKKLRNRYVMNKSYIPCSFGGVESQISVKFFLMTISGKSNLLKCIIILLQLKF